MMRACSIYLFIFVCLLHASVAVAASKGEHSRFKNEELLAGLFNKLHNLETSRHGKVNIVHIGDSHVQADFFTGAIRKALQSRFGNGGYGFTFPYSLARTNGTNTVRYKSNTQWQSSLSNNVSGIKIGLSGIGLQTTSQNFYIELDTNDDYRFNTVKALSLGNQPCFDLSLSIAKSSGVSQPAQPADAGSNAQYHKVKKGETLYRISVNYHTTVEGLKKANNLGSDVIEIDMLLRIPDHADNTKNNRHSMEEMVVKKDSLTVENQKYVSVYRSWQPLSRIYILPDKKSSIYNLNGIVLENDTSGLIYHAIGVNGAKTSDFNKHPAFFDQLVILNPDLIIISLGTNESFGRWISIDYMYQLTLMIRNIRKTNRNTPILVMSPPPSMLRRNKPNTFIEAYSKALLETNEYVVWDLFSEMGGIYAPKDKAYAPLMAKDKIHYTKEGYRKQAELFSSGLLGAYDKYIKTN
jgi:LysM repeat protein